MLVLLAACAGPKVSDPTGGHSAVQTATTGTTAASGTAETGPRTSGETGATTDPPWPDGCDPAIGIPGVVEGPAVQPSAETYGPTPTPFGTHLGWPGTDPSVSASFVWRTDVGTLASTVSLRAGGGPEVLLSGASFTYGASGETRVHEVKACRTLTPGTTYQYKVGGPGGWSPTYEFTTPLPPDQVRSVRVAFLGDSRGSYTRYAWLLRAIAQAAPDFVVFTGDAVTAGTNQDEWDAWFAAAAGLAEHTPIVAAKGNHEGTAVNWFAEMSLPDNELWYPVRYGPLELLFLDDTGSTADLGTQADVIDQVLGASDATWKVVVHHQPEYATCTRHGSNLTLRNLWTPRYEADGVDLVLAGHNHLYERSAPILGGAVAEPGPGVTYVVAGGAGAPVYPATTPQWFSDVATPVQHYGIADFGPDGVDVEVRDLTGNVIDSFSLPAD